MSDWERCVICGEMVENWDEYKDKVICDECADFIKTKFQIKEFWWYRIFIDDESVREHVEQLLRWAKEHKEKGEDT